MRETKPRRPDAAPPPEFIFQPVYDRYGIRQTLVFGNHAPNGACPYFTANLCQHCQCGAGEGATFDTSTNVRRLRWFQSCYDEVLRTIAHVCIHNSGSVLNPRELPAQFLEEVLGFFIQLPTVKVFSFETREAYISAARLTELSDVVGSARVVRPCLGVETADDEIREGFLEKRMSRQGIEKAFDAVATAVAKVGRDRVGMEVNLIAGLPGTDANGAHGAAEDVAASATWLMSLARKRAISLDINIVPYYPTERGWESFPTHPSCSLGVLVQCVAAVDRVRRLLQPSTGVFVEWQDEGHDQEKGKKEKIAVTSSLFQRFNHTQDVADLPQGA